VKIGVRLFAVARERVGASSIDVEVTVPTTVRALRGALVEQYPVLRDVVPHVRFAVDSEYAAESKAISPQSEVAVIPPVSGG
jgi:molybdopterin converting factor subunit 1